MLADFLKYISDYWNYNFLNFFFFYNELLPICGVGMFTSCID